MKRYLKVFNKLFNKLIRWLGFKPLTVEITYTSPEEARKLFGMDKEEELVKYLGVEIKKAMSGKDMFKR